MLNTRDIVYIALFAAIMALLAIFPAITLPLTAVPVTAQSMGVMLAGGILGAKRAGLSIILFLVLVAIGLPILAGGRGGLAVFAGPTVGFLIGWVISAAAVGWLTERFWNRMDFLMAFAICLSAGVILLYIIGAAGLALVAGMPFLKALFVSFPFLPGDLIKSAIAAQIIVIVHRSYPLIKKH